MVLYLLLFVFVIYKKNTKNRRTYNLKVVDTDRIENNKHACALQRNTILLGIILHTIVRPVSIEFHQSFIGIKYADVAPY